MSAEQFSGSPPAQTAPPLCNCGGSGWRHFVDGETWAYDYRGGLWYPRRVRCVECPKGRRETP